MSTAQPERRHGRCAARLLIVLVVVAGMALPAGPAAADQASQPSSAAAGRLSTGDFHSCALVDGSVRCWGFSGDGQLGNANVATIGDDETPDRVAPVNLGSGRTVQAISSGDAHTCAILDDDAVRCWGFGGDGRLGYAGTKAIGDDEAPGSAGPVNLGAGRTAKAISAGSGHTCALLDDDAVRCWGFADDGRLGYNSTDNVGDNETPAAAGPVDFGPGRTAKAVSAGGYHTCAILNDDTVRCWGFGDDGRLGYANTATVGRGCRLPTSGSTCIPAPRTENLGPVDLGAGRTAKAISAGLAHTCAVLDDGSVRCWGRGGGGRLGYGNEHSIGDNESAGAAGPVDLGPGRTAQAIDAGGAFSCALLDNGAVRCWGFNSFGQLGYANTAPIGDGETPGSAGPVDLGPGRTATAISLGALHMCARLDDGAVRCWGYGANGRLGLCATASIGDDEAPSAVGPVALGITGITGEKCAEPIAPAAPPPPEPPPPALPPPPAAEVTLQTPPPETAAPDLLAPALARQRARAQLLQACRRAADRRLDADRRRARAVRAGRRPAVLRLASRRAAARQSACRGRHGRIPGRIDSAGALKAGRGVVAVSFRAAGSDGASMPAARRYLVKQSPRPIRTTRDFERAFALCRGGCAFDITSVGASLKLTVNRLRPGRRYYYAIAARDNVSLLRGPRSRMVSAVAG